MRILPDTAMTREMLADGSHACAGKNECKGKGWVKVKSEEECTKKGGNVVKEEKSEDKA